MHIKRKVLNAFILKLEGMYETIALVLHSYAVKTELKHSQ